jgi:hypothetical protein
MNQIANTDIELVVNELPITRNEAQRLYMNKRNNDNVEKARRERNSQRANRCFNVPEDVGVKFKNNIHRLVELKTIVNEMPPEMLNYFLLNHSAWSFEKRPGLKTDGTPLIPVEKKVIIVPIKRKYIKKSVC